MKYRILFFLIIGGLSLNSYGQGRLKHYEFGFGLGTLSSANDIATSPSVSTLFKEVRPQARIFGVLHTNDWFGFGADLNYGWIFMDDLNHTNASRGLEAYTTMTQINAFVEFNFIRYGKFHRETKFGIYSRLGGGFLAYNPNLSFTKLQPANIEVFPDSYTAANYFIAFGLKFRTDYKSSLRLEAYFHGTGIDNIEGFENSPKSASATNDIYGGAMISYCILFF